MALIGTWSLADAPTWGRLGLGHATGTTPPFSAEVRDRTVVEAGGVWALPPARLSAHVEAWRWDRYADARFRGPGDITLGVEADVWRGAGVVWLTKLPNAEDEEGLGTDETDITLLARLHHPRPDADLTLSAMAGITVMGDPTRYRSQDRALTTWGVLGWQDTARLRLGGLWPSAHNPARLEVALSARLPLPLATAALGLEVEGHRTGTASGVGLRLWLEARRPLP